MNIHELDSIYYEESLREEFDLLAQDCDLPIEDLAESYPGEDEEDDDYILLPEFYDLDFKKPIRIGQVVMTNSYHGKYSNKENDPHRVLIVSASGKDSDGIAEYKGYIMSSKADEKANIKGKYPNNLYIDDFSTIFDKSTNAVKGDHKSDIIKVDELVEFTNEDMSESGVWKGDAKPEFIKFVTEGRTNFTTGNQKKNFKLVWPKSGNWNYDGDLDR